MDLNTVRIYTIFHHTYRLLYRKGHIQITNNNSIINMKTNEIEKNKLDLNTLIFYTILFHHTYRLLYCKGHVQITSNNTIIYMKRKAIE